MAQTSTSFKPGHDKLPGAGRPKGSQDKVSRPMRALLSGHLEDSFERFKSELADLEGKEYVEAYLKALKFVLPQLQSLKVDDVTGGTRSITLKLQNLMGQTKEK